jgi:hypothetical protein
MTIYIEWDDEEKTIIRYTFFSGWTIEEFHRLYDKPTEMIEESSAELIGVIIDDSRDSMPPKKAILAFGRTVREGQLPIVIVGITPAAKILVESARRAYKSVRPLFYVDNLEQARKILQNHAKQADNSSDEDNSNL